MRFEANSFPTPSVCLVPGTRIDEKINDHAAREARSGESLILSPIVDVARDGVGVGSTKPWGRHFWLAAWSRDGPRTTRSSDGTIDSDHVAATLKHFAGYAGTAGGRNRSPYTHGPATCSTTKSPPSATPSVRPGQLGWPPSTRWMGCPATPTHDPHRRFTTGLIQGAGRRRLPGNRLGPAVPKNRNLGCRCSPHGFASRPSARAAQQLWIQAPSSIDPRRQGFRINSRYRRPGRTCLEVSPRPFCSSLPAGFRKGQGSLPLRSHRVGPQAAVQSIVLLRNDKGLSSPSKDRYKKIAIIGPNAKVCRLATTGAPLKPFPFEGVRDFLGD